MNNFMKPTLDSVKENSAELLLGLGIGGWAATSVLVGISTYKAMQDLEELGEDIPRKEIVKRVWKYYIFPTATGILSTGFLIGSGIVSNKKIAAIAALATESALSESRAVSALSEYRKKVADKLGAEDEKDIHKEVVREQAQRDYDSALVAETGHGRYLIYDRECGRFYRSNIIFIESCVNKINEKLPDEMRIAANEFYSMQGLDPIGFGRKNGFDIDRGYLELDSYGGNHLDNGEPYTVIAYETYDISKRY